MDVMHYSSFPLNPIAPLSSNCYGMLDTQSILRLYANVLENDVLRYNIPTEAIVNGIESMKEVYRPETTSLCSQHSNVADYNDVAYRCAYLHKYAAFHTVMVRDMMCHAIKCNFALFYRYVFAGNCFRLCSLGGGPGSDVLGVLAALHSAFSYFDASVCIVDCMVNWSYSFRSILQELGTGWYGAFGNNAGSFLSWRYMYGDLLDSLSIEVNTAISAASLVTMVKFASAAACQDTENMVKNIFRAMQPGALLLFVDNDAGGFHELIMKAAIEQDFISIYGPYRHENYRNENMKIRRFGILSCYKTTVTVHILQKPFHSNQNYSPNLNNAVRPYILNQNRTVSLGTPYDNYENIHVNIPNQTFTNENSYAQPLQEIDFSDDEHSNDPNNNFRSPLQDIPQSPNLIASYIASPFNRNSSNYMGVNTPLSTPCTKSKKKRRKGCLSVPKLKRWRHNLASKVNKIKSRARSYLNKKNKKKHPVFRL